MIRSHVVTGWIFVLAQAILLIALIALPGADHWLVPDWLRWLGTAVITIGLVLVVIAALRLGPSATPTPVPNGRGALATTGLYRFSRHPIYSGVLLAVVGVVIRSGNLVTAIVGLATAGFFVVKSSWEEDRLRERYDDYDRYAESTGRFFPRILSR